MKIKTHCSQCGKNIVLYRYAPQKNHFCNSACYGLWQRGRPVSKKHLESLKKSRKHGKPNVKCSYCGVRFHKHPSEIYEHSFCNLEHKYKFSFKRIKPKICSWCKKEYFSYHKPSKFCSSKCMGFARRKPFIIKGGYKRVLLPDHPRADKKGYTLEHIIILEKKLGRSLEPKEVAHHIDENKLNNKPNNLTTFPNNVAHLKFHNSK